MPLLTDMFLRRAEREDLDTIVEWMERPDFQHFLYGDSARSQRQIREQIVGLLGRSSGGGMPGSVYLLIDSKEHGPAGLISLQNISWRNRSCALDLYIGNTELRKGLTTAISIFRALEYCFHELNLHRVSAFIYSFNTASWRIFEKSGAQREVVLREHIARDGKLHDVYGYGILRPEFEAMRERYQRVTEGVALNTMIEALAREEAEATP